MLTIRVTLNEYLDSLRAAETESRRLLPAAERRRASKVPSLRALARACNSDPNTMSLLASNQRDNLELLGCVVWALRDRGYPAELTDLLELAPVSTSNN